MATSEEFYCDQADTMEVQNTFRVIFFFSPSSSTFLAHKESKTHLGREKEQRLLIFPDLPPALDPPSGMLTAAVVHKLKHYVTKTGVGFDGDSQLNPPPSKHTIKTRKPVMCYRTSKKKKKVYRVLKQETTKSLYLQKGGAGFDF